MLESVTCGDTEISSANLRTAMRKLNRLNPADNTTGLHTQFKVCLLIRLLLQHICVFNYMNLFCRFWIKYLLNRARHSALLLSNILNDIGQIGFYQVSMRNCLIYNGTIINSVHAQLTRIEFCLVGSILTTFMQLRLM